MDTLRLVLVLFGIVVVFVVYIFTRKSSGLPLFGRRLDETEIDDLIPEPAILSDEDIAGAIRNKRYASDIPEEHNITQLSEMLSTGVKTDIDSDEIGSMSSLSEDELGESLIIIFNIMAKNSQFLHGLDILEATLSAGLKHGEMNIFHYVDNSVSDMRAVCGLANSVEPGFFEIDKIEELKTPGLTLFMQLPGPLDGRSAFEQTLKIGRSLAEYLDADLCDETRSVVTMQSIEHLKEKIEAYCFKARIAQIQHHRQQ